MSADLGLDPEKWIPVFPTGQTRSVRPVIMLDKRRQREMTKSSRSRITEWAMTEQEEHRVRERKEIAARVASFKAMQQKFERERHEYYATTLGNAWDGFTQRSL
jgi:hypothetical protein